MAKRLATRPYSGPSDSGLPDNVKGLPDHAREIWVAAFNSAWDGWSSDKTDLTQEGYAHAVAWAAVKKLYKKNAEGAWVKRSLAWEGQGRITKVWRSADGAHHWRATVMDDGVDCYATRMTIDFQDDVCQRADAGPMPWLGIAHYGRQSQIGEATRLYRDGRFVKAEGVFTVETGNALQRQLARAAYEAAESESDLLPAHRAIATSQAFYPEAHAVEDCGVLAYTRGRMDHIALTTRPGNSRADFGVEEDEMRSSKTRRDLRRDDAAAIVGPDLAKALDASQQAKRSAAGDDEDDDGLIYRMAADGTVELTGDADRTPPAERDAANLRDWAEAMEEVEVLAGAGHRQPADVENARAFFRHRLGDGTIHKPTLAEARAMFAEETALAGALLRATGETNFAKAIRAVVSDPDQVGPAPAPAPAAKTRAGRRVKAEMLDKAKKAMEQAKSAGDTMKEFVAWATQNMPADTSSRAIHRSLAADADYRAQVTERWGAEPDDSVIETMNTHALVQAASEAGYTFIDIVIANIQAEDLDQSTRLANVQRALNEFGQIIAQIIAHVAAQQEPRSSGAAAGNGVKPDGAGGAAAAPSGGPDPEARAAVTASLEDIDAALDGGVTPDEMQGLLEQLTENLRRCLPPPPAADGATVEILARLRAIEDRISAGPPPADPPPGDEHRMGPPAAPPRRKGMLPRLGTDVLRQRRSEERPGPYGWSPSQFAHGAHHRAAFDPRE